MANILVVGPHPDDQELGMGGTIAKLVSQNHRVLLLDMTNGEPTPYGDPETRAVEAAKAAEILSSPENPVQRHLLELPNRSVEHTLQARHKVAGVIRRHQAEIIFVPFPEDAHPDHRAVTRIVEDARFDAKLTKVSMPGDEDQPPIYPRWLFYYYASHLRWVANPNFIMDITGFEARKIESIRAYHTQFVLPEKNQQVVKWVEAGAIYFGSRIGVAGGEPFYTKEPIGLTSLGSLS